MGVNPATSVTDTNGRFHHVTNDQNRPGISANRFVARIKATLAWHRSGALR